MSSDPSGASRGELLALAILLAAAAATMALRLPSITAEAHAMAADIARDGAGAATCGATTMGSGEVAAVLAAIDGLQGRAPVGAPGCAAYLRFAAS